MSVAHASADFAAETRAPAVARRWEIVGAALCLAQFSEPLFAAIAQSQGLTEPPGYARIFFLPVYAFLGVVIWRDRRAALATAFAAPVLMSLLALAFVSTLWSIDSGATLRRSVWLALTMAFGCYMAWRYSWRELVEVIGGAFLALIAGSFVVSILMPNVGIMSQEHPGAWCGLWTHKNTLGGIMALGVGVCAAAAIVAPARRTLWIGAALGAFALVLLSTSKTALLASMLQLAVIAAGMIARRGPLFAIATSAAAIGAIILIASIVLLAPELLVTLIGRDLTLTGRTDIWEAAAPAVAAHSWLGYGYFAFWVGDLGPAYWVRETVQWPVASAHSGWLELALGLGRVGVVLFAVQLLITCWRGAAAIATPHAGLWAPAFLAAFAMYTMSESHVLQANNLFWTIYVAVAARLALKRISA